MLYILIRLLIGLIYCRKNSAAIGTKLCCGINAAFAIRAKHGVGYLREFFIIIS